jgi:hypothetical protein
MLRKPALAALIAMIALAALPSGGSASTTNTRIISGPSGTIFTDSATFAFASPEDGGFQCRLDSGDWRDWGECSSPWSYSSLADGPHRFEVRALNRAHHPDPTPAVASFTVKTDTYPPETTIVAGPGETIAIGTAIFGFESTEPGSFECRLDSDADSVWAPCASPQLYSNLADGPHAFEVRASDEVGNTDPTPAVASFAIDTTPPETTIASAPSGTVETASASFAFAATEAGSFQCRLDSSDPGAWSDCSSPQSYSALADGPHGFEVRAADRLGNTDPTPAIAPFTVYTGPPKPVAGKTINLEPVGGTVELQCPGEDEFNRLTSFRQVPLGCLINTRHGVVNLTASKGQSGALQDANFWGGVFITSQKTGDNQEVELKLAGRRMCERRSLLRKPVATLSRSGAGGGRKLWGDGKGDYKTSGSHGSATVRGTTWLVVDRCDASTLIKVAEGTVSVRDFAKDKSVTLTSGEQYVAKAPIPRLNPNLFP